MRHPTPEDLEGVAELIATCDLFERAESDFSIEELSLEWRRPDFNLDEDAWVVLTSGGSVVGYEEVYNRKEHYRLSGDGYVHPGHRGHGIGTALLKEMEVRARQHIPLAPLGVEVTLRNGVSAVDLAGRDLHVHEGYFPVRYFWRMQTNMLEAPPEPSWPSGVLVRNVLPEQDERPLFEAFREAFEDHWGDAPWDYDTWRERRFRSESFDPSLWFLALADEQIVGGVIGRYRQQTGWVGQLAVRSAWRRRGLGLALLLRVLREFYQRGTHQVGLGVDANNPTGATRLYERAGMYVDSEYIVYEKVLRPAGEFLSTTSGSGMHGA